MMPLLFCLGQHEALRATQEQLRDGEHLLAFLDDIKMVTRANRAGPVHANLQENLHVHACIRIHCGKTRKVWNKAGIRPAACDALERIARTGNPRATVWKGPGVPTHEQGIKVLGTPLGHEDFVATHLESVLTEHHTFISRIPEVKDVQSAWLLLFHCASSRACYLARVVRPSAVGDFTETHDRTLWQCLSDILKVDPLQCDEVVRDAVGSQEFRADASSSILGELGRLPAHDA